MKISSLNSVPFQKKLVANCAVSGTSGKIPCSIYRLEKGDENYFEDVYCTPGWKNGYYILSADFDTKNGYIDSMYVLEDKKNNCLGYTELIDPKDERNIIEFLEVKPACRHKNPKRTKKYTGETLLNFIAQISEKMGKETVHVIFPVKSAYDFYVKCGFKREDDEIGLKLNKKDALKLQDTNYAHTGSKIEFIG